MSSPTQKVKVAAKFNYEALESQQRVEIKQATTAIREKLRRAAQDIWEIGRMLSEVQSTLKRGQFDDWLKTEFDWSRRTAYKFISVYKRFDRNINLGEIDIATSALYLLAAESTPEEIREEFIQKAQDGQKITHQAVFQVVQESKEKSSNQSQQSEFLETYPTAENILEISSLDPKAFDSQPTAVIPQAELEKPITDLTEAVDSNVIINLLEIKTGWYKLRDQHSVFCGDTALPEFANRIPYATLAIAITSDDWAHDWLIEKAKTVIVFPESEYERQKLTGLIVMFSSADDIIIFPWLPEAEMIEVAHQLGRKVYAGDINPQHCKAAITQTGLLVEKIKI